MSAELARRRWLIWVWWAVAVAVLIGALALPVPYVIVSPGPVFNTIGEVDGQKVIQVSGTTTYPTDGALDMTTVTERGGPYGPLTAGEAVVALFRPAAAVVPREFLFAPDKSDEQSKQESAAAFDSAQSNAVAAALGHLGIPTTAEVLVSSVAAGSPAAGVLVAGDVIVSVAGAPVTSVAQAVETIRSTAPGTTIDITVRRDGTEVPLQVTVGENPDRPGKGYLGATLSTRYQGPFEVNFSLSGVGGPSAGLMFTLGLIDELTPESLTGGATVAGTGTMDPQGNVGAIGGIGQKMAAARSAGATLFLAPTANCPQVTGAVPDGLTVAAVATVDEALTALDEVKAGRTPRPCPVS